MSSQRKALLFAAFMLTVAALIWAAVIEMGAQRDREERARSLALYTQVVSNLHVSMSETEVDAITKQATKSFRCAGQTSWEEVHLFGSKRPELAGILYLRFDSVDGKEVITQIADLDYYKLPTYETRCQIIEH